AASALGWGRAVYRLDLLGNPVRGGGDLSFRDAFSEPRRGQMKLLRKPAGQHGLVHHITPENAGWSYVGFDLWRLEPGEVASGQTGGNEAILVIVEGKARVSGAGQDWGEMGERMDV